MEAVIASFGGAGTTYIIRALRSHIRINDDNDDDRMKHLPLPPFSLNPRFKCVYVFSNPVLAVISIFRRGFYRNHCHKMHGGFRGNRGMVGKTMSIEEYAALGSDQLGLERHFANWFDRYRLSPTLFIRYETLWQNRGHLCSFLGLGRECADSFPEFVERRSRRELVPPLVWAQLNATYSGFSARLAALGDFSFREAKNRTTLGRFVSGNARMAVRRWLMEKAAVGAPWRQPRAADRVSS